MAYDRRKMSEQLRQRTQESIDSKDESGLFPTIFDPSMEIPSWKCKPDKHEIDMIPYKVGKYDPKLDKGDTSFHLDIYVHYNVGPANEPMICPLRTQKKTKENCPICEYIKNLYNQMGEDAREDERIKKIIGKLKAKRRVLYNIICYDSKEEEKKGIQVWDASHFAFHHDLVEAAENPKEGGNISFADPDVGKTIYFKREGSKQEDTRFSGIKFYERDYKIPDRVLDQVFTLDEIVQWPTYDDIKKAFYAGQSELEDDRREPEPDRGTRRRFEDDSPEESRTTRKGKRFEEEEENDRSPRGRRGGEPGELECPHSGGHFGNPDEIDNYRECLKCLIYKECDEAAKKKEKKEEERPSLRPRSRR